MEEPKKCAWASAYQNQDIMWVCTYSGYRGSAYDPKGKEAVLRVNSDDKTLGVAVNEALEHSRFLSLEEANVFLDYRNGTQEYDARIRALVESQRYRTKTALFNQMKRCNIKLAGGIIKIAPSVHKGSDSWRRNKSDGLEDVVISADRSPSEIGTALRIGFSRCVV